MTTPAPNDATGTITTQYDRDQYERLVKTIFPDNSTQLIGYDTLGRPTSGTDEDNHTSTSNYDALGRVVSVVNAMNGTVSTTYDRDGNVLTTTDEMGDVTTNTWNARNELVKQVLPDPDGAGPLASPVLQWTYDVNGDKLTESDGMGRVTSWGYDKMGRVSQETLPDPDGPGPLASPVITFGYDRLGRETVMQDALGGITSLAYANTDESQVTSMTLPDPDGAGPLTSPVTSYHYDTLGRNDQTTDPMNHVETTSFDADGHTASVLDNLGHGTTYTYGHLGEQLTSTDALSHTISEQYDLRLRMISSTDANGGVTQNTFDPAGNRIAVVDPDNNKTTFVFDALNRETSDTNSLNFTEYFTWDPSSDMTSMTDRDGRVRDLQYDNLHRQTAEDWMNGNTVAYAVATAYDADNEITSTSDPDSASAMTYDNLGDAFTVDNAGTPNVPHVVLTSGYDAGSDRTSLAASINGTADFLNSYVYDTDQRITSEVQQQQSGGNGVSPKELDFGYNALGQFTSAARYDFIGIGPRTDIATGAFSYDGANRLTGLNYTYAGGGYSIDGYTLGYDNADRLRSSTSTADGTASYGYDNTNQIVSANYTGANAPPNAAYSFDKSGNRTMSGYQTGTGNQLASDGTFNYQYDANGNRTVRTRISNSPASDYQVKYTYDYRNRETDEEYFNNNGVLTKHVHLVYDTLDNEIGKQVDDTGGGTYDRTERYVLDGPQPVAQFDGVGNLTERDLSGPSPTGVDEVMAQEGIATQGQAGTTNWDLTDELGTVHDVVSNNSAVVDHVIGDAFGQTTMETNATVTHWDGFAGGHTDSDTKDVLNGERRYDASTGDWTTKDPIGFAGGDANTGRYSGNSPTNLVDPSGLADQEAAPPFEYTQIPIKEYSSEQGWDAQTKNSVLNGGCETLTVNLLGTPPGKVPFNAPGVVSFASYAAAQQYFVQQNQNGQNPTMFAYQNTVKPGIGQFGVPTSTPGFAPAAPGAIDPQTVAPGYYMGEKNFSTAVYDSATQTWNWVWMGNSGGNIAMAPIKPKGPVYGLCPDCGTIDPLTGQPKPFLTNVFCVKVNPPPPPSLWQKLWDVVYTNAAHGPLAKAGSPVVGVH